MVRKDTKNMNREELKPYLLTVAQEGYANKEKTKEWVKERDGSTTITHQKGQWSMNDNFYGGEPYGGREVILYEGKPVWIMVYYGEVSATVEDIGEVYSFLQDALKIPDENLPLRGPKVYENGQFRYKFRCTGDIFRFNGKEKILKGEEEIYSASVIGGLVNQREE